MRKLAAIRSVKGMGLIFALVVAGVIVLYVVPWVFGFMEGLFFLLLQTIGEIVDDVRKNGL